MSVIEVLRQSLAAKRSIEPDRVTFRRAKIESAP